MEENFIEKIISEHDKTEAFISLFCAGIDALMYFCVLFLFGCDYNKKCFSSRQKTSMLIIVDTLFRIIYLSISTLEYLFLKEIILSILATIIFLITIILLNNILKDKNMDNAEIRLPFITSIAFFLLSINLINFEIPKYFILGKYIISIFAVIVYTYYIGRKVEIFLSCVERKNLKHSGKLLHNLTIFIGFYYIIYLGLKILSMFFENEFYIEIGIDIIKEMAKFMAFCLVISLYYLFQKYIKDDDYDYASYTQQSNVIIN
jgi:hypothetical protein